MARLLSVKVNKRSVMNDAGNPDLKVWVAWREAGELKSGPWFMTDLMNALTVNPEGRDWAVDPALILDKLEKAGEIARWEELTGQ